MYATSWQVVHEDTVEDLGLADSLELFRAAHFWQLKGLSRCLCQRLPRLAQDWAARFGLDLAPTEVV